MKYKINAFLYYDATEGSLKLDDDGTSDTTLSITANALLYVLIQNPGVMTRDSVMKQVWDDNGLVSSNSNLNQYISLLRKTFRNYGIENIIVTIPKGRLEINPTLTIEVIDNNILHPVLQQQLIHDELADKQQETSDKAKQEKSTEISVDKNWGYAGLFIFIFACVMFFISHLSESASPQGIKLTAVDHDRCELLSIEKMINTAVKEGFIKSFDAVRTRLSINCGEDERFLFYYGDKLQTNGLGRTFLAHCAKHEDNPFSYCENYFYYAWK
ncbi:Transcriptional regulatory protein, C terminal [Pragia fontium]|uniref:DNA-binding winged helix-turn-helix (WHTH) domain-containing protein n=2 Tax=Pragia fontium TaxID=82985 RepID=A0AAJ4WBW2_9GAMM|nr:winged helix-turn-helix domain-containing protein [Pragia fontium]GKX62619.1 transcriptional regulator [Pragia fontium]SFD11570.1 DNA-binding winged helix-turn-helix (wHTH) domain-containing protein [Pragia fontium DSM 5563 = ATCC 49100]SUB82875.1 Transcriptional regulatory protein, C terminal [Pragia fontium]